MTATLSKEMFLSIARASGLDVEDPHMEELYAFVQKVLPGLRVIDQLDLTGVEPLATFIPEVRSQMSEVRKTETESRTEN